MVSVDTPRREISDVPVQGKKNTVPQVSKDPLVTAITDLIEEIKALRLEVSTASLKCHSSPVSSRPGLGSAVSAKRPAFFMEAGRQPPSKISSTSFPVLVQRAFGSTTLTERKSYASQSSQASLARTILYFRGLGRRDVWEVRQLFTTLGIPSQAVQFVSFIGANITELIVLASFKDDVVKKLATANLKLDPTFDPLHPKSFTGSTTMIQDVCLADKSKLAKQAFVSRMNFMLSTISHHRHGLRSFLRSLKKAIENDVPAGHFFHPIP